MTTYSSILAWRIAWTEEPGYSPQGCKESDMTESHTHTHTHTQCCIYIYSCPQYMCKVLLAFHYDYDLKFPIKLNVLNLKYGNWF